MLFGHRVRPTTCNWTHYVCPGKVWAWTPMFSLSALFHVSYSPLPIHTPSYALSPWSQALLHFPPTLAGSCQDLCGLPLTIYLSAILIDLAASHFSSEEPYCYSLYAYCMLTACQALIQALINFKRTQLRPPIYRWKN